MVDCKRFENKKICVALSGGADSVALLHYLKERREEGKFLLSALHCEHGIRGEESLEDMRFVQALCQSWQIPLKVVREDCLQRAELEKVSLETAARNFRYQQFSTLLEEGEADYVATAHHKGDGAETVLFRIARGSALTGASGIRKENGKIIRPFLEWTKAEILGYIREKGLQFREDSTNFEREATRNKIRLEILPKLEEAVPEAAENLLRFARLAAEDDELLYRLSLPLVTEWQGAPAVKFSREKPLFTRACLLAMKRAGLCKDYTENHLAALFALQNLERGAVIVLPQGLRARKEENCVRFYKEEGTPLPLNSEAPFSTAGYDGGRYAVKLDFSPIEGGGKYPVLRADLDKIPASAKFRFREGGDYIYRFGGGKKSLKKFFNEEKVPVEEREGLPLIAEENGEVYAVCGVEISQKIAVDERTKKVVYITIRKKEK